VALTVRIAELHDIEPSVGRSFVQDAAAWLDEGLAVSADTIRRRYAASRQRDVT
jgi:hypothetical protein